MRLKFKAFRKLSRFTIALCLHHSLRFTIFIWLFIWLSRFHYGYHKHRNQCKEVLTKRSFDANRKYCNVRNHSSFLFLQTHYIYGLCYGNSKLNCFAIDIFCNIALLNFQINRNKVIFDSTNIDSNILLVRTLFHLNSTAFSVKEHCPHITYEWSFRNGNNENNIRWWKAVFRRSYEISHAWILILELLLKPIFFFHSNMKYNENK